MPTFSKIAKHGVVLSAAGMGLGAAVYLVRELVQNGTRRDGLTALATGTAIVGLGGSVLYYACRQMGCECVSDSPTEPAAKPMKPDPILAKSYEGTKGFNPLLAYAAEHSSPHPLVRSLLDETLKGARGGMASSPETCTFLTIVSQAMGARKVLDVGVFTGLSALSMGLGLSENGRVIACEINDGEAQQLARKYWKIAGIASKVDLTIQPAADTLQGLIDNGESGTFDIAFIDADKSNYLTYYRLCYALLRRGGVIIVDNTLWSGKVVDPKQNDNTTVGMRQFNEEVRNDDRVRCLQLVLGDGTTVIQKL